MFPKHTQIHEYRLMNFSILKVTSVGGMWLSGALMLEAWVQSSRLGEEKNISDVFCVML